MLNAHYSYIRVIGFVFMRHLGITMPQPRHGLSQSRLSVVRTMLRRGRYVLQNLENPNIQESPAEYNGNNMFVFLTYI